jgi:hypothetical protein
MSEIARIRKLEKLKTPPMIDEAAEIIKEHGCVLACVGERATTLHALNRRE